MQTKNLRSQPLFADLDEETLTVVIGRSATLCHAPATVVVSEGDTGRETFLVIEGRARVTRGGQELAELGPGELFGEMAAIGDGTRTATVTALTPLELL